MTLRTLALIAVATLPVCAAPSVAAADARVQAGTRLAGLRTGAYAAGFEVRSRTDASRRINAADGGTKIGLAIWYPARQGAAGDAMTALEYRCLDSLRPLGRRQRQAREDEDVNGMVASRHIGIVELTPAQARASLASHGIAIRNAAAAEGRFPVVLVTGGPYYLSTTAEVLATHGFLVVASFRYADQSNEIGTEGFTWYVENGVRDAEWALVELAQHPHADVRRVAALGHGGGGMTAMLLAMRSRGIDALVNIDAGNFSSRSEAEKIAFYSPRLVTVPYLYIATASTRKVQDRFDHFLAMRFSDRTEIELDAAALRHHDLSDLGRAVTAPLGIRGEAQAAVQQAFSDVHELTVRFLTEQIGGRTERLASWLETQQTPGRFTASFHSGVRPAPTEVDVVGALGATTVARLRDARQRDPEAPVFAPDGLARIVEEAIGRGDRPLAMEMSSFAVELHPDVPRLLELNSQALEASGDRPGALHRAKACAAIDPGRDWQAGGAVVRCREAIARLSPKS